MSIINSLLSESGNTNMKPYIFEQTAQTTLKAKTNRSMDYTEGSIMNNNNASLTQRLFYRGTVNSHIINYKDYGEKSNYYAHQKTYMMNYLKTKYRMEEDQTMNPLAFSHRKSIEVMHEPIKSDTSKPKTSLRKNNKCNNDDNAMNNNNTTTLNTTTKKSSVETKRRATDQNNNRVSKHIALHLMAKKKKAVNNSTIHQEDNTANIKKAMVNKKKAQAQTQSPNKANVILQSEKKRFNIKKEIHDKEIELTFTPVINTKNKIKSKYLMNLTSNSSPKRNNFPKVIRKMNKTITRQHNSFDLTNTFDDKQKDKLNHSEISDHWTSELVKLTQRRRSSSSQQKEGNEILYKININDKGAWNDNCINSVRINDKTKAILLSLLS